MEALSHSVILAKINPTCIFFAPLDGELEDTLQQSQDFSKRERVRYIWTALRFCKFRSTTEIWEHLQTTCHSSAYPSFIQPSVATLAFAA